jgi:uncharacterized protein (TIGR02145 family)
MRNSIFLIVVGTIFIWSCKPDEEDNTNGGGKKIIKEQVNGNVQKGPFINGTEVSMFVLDQALSQTGSVFSTQIINNMGTFEFKNLTLSSSFVEFSVSGYYFDEVKGEISIAPLNLYALADITDISTVNVNILTHLEKSRVKNLVIHGKTFTVAKDSAQSELLTLFGLDTSNMENSEKLDISESTDGNAILLAISIIMQGNRSVGTLTELLASFSSKLEDGIAGDSSIVYALREPLLQLDLQSIRQKLESRYESLGAAVTIPNFEKYIQSFLSYTGKTPTIENNDSADIKTNSATLFAPVNPNSLTTTVSFEYGTTTSYGNIVAANQSPVYGSYAVVVSGSIFGLDPGTTYHYRIKAENSLGITYSNDLQFTTQGMPPMAISLEPTNIDIGAATLNGSINANYLATSVSFEYGTTTSYGSTVPATKNPVTGNSDRPASVSITGLTAGTTYHYRVIAENSLGITYGNDLQFATLGIVNDLEGNSYKTVTIGNQTWMAENLKTIKFNDGTNIPEVTDNAAWAGLTTPGYCWYNNDANIYKATYGALYNFFTINTGKLCPAGWHVPCDAEWSILTDYLGGVSIAGGKMKEIGTTHWDNPNTGASNSSGFAGLPGGYRNYLTGDFIYVGNSGYWWSSTEYAEINAWFRLLHYSINNVGWGSGLPKQVGFSVRCLKD